VTARNHAQKEKTAARRREVDFARRVAAIQAVWARIPDVGCQRLCQRCCGPIGMSETERELIFRKYGIRIRDGETQPGTMDCPALKDGACLVRDSRPTVCRLWGAVQALPCQHGCRPPGGLLDDRTAADIMRASLAVDGDHPLTGTVLDELFSDPSVAALWGRAARGDRSVLPELASAASRVYAGQAGGPQATRGD
jgi:hypothetical protein